MTSVSPDATRRFAAGMVALVGRPNVGKSTLANLIVGEKVAIVSGVPQTTRRRLQGVRNLPGGQIVVVDTPGIHKPRHEMNRRMVADATGVLNGVDLTLFLVEAPTGTAGARLLGPGDKFVLSLLPREGPPVLLVINKIDTVPRQRLLPAIEATKGLFPFAGVLLVSALTGENTSDLLEILLSHLPEGPPLYPEGLVTDQRDLFMTSEIIREKILHHTRQEIPHETCVLIDHVEDTESGLRRIHATILVEKESQRKVVIGREGSLLKTIGTEARQELEHRSGVHVFLDLWVKVRRRWRDDPATLSHLGLGPA